MYTSQRNKRYMQLAWVVPHLEDAILDWVRVSKQRGSWNG